MMLARNPVSVWRHRGIVEIGATATHAAPARPLPFEVQLARDREFVGLLNACRRSGGLARADEIIRRLGLRPSEADRQLNDWIANRQICHLEWRGRVWIPRFQFEQPMFEPMPPLSKVIAEWDGALDGFELCLWFVTPNAWLGGATPAETLDDVEEVCNAARAFRFFRCG